MQGYDFTPSLAAIKTMLHGFVKAVTWMCQSCSMYFYPFAKQNQAKWFDQDFKSC